MTLRDRGAPRCQTYPLACPSPYVCSLASPFGSGRKVPRFRPATHFLYVKAVASDLGSVRMVLAQVTTVEEVTLVETVEVYVGLEWAGRREVSLVLAFSV